LLVGADGGVFAFGAVNYQGSVNQPDNPGAAIQPVVGMSANVQSTGYYEEGDLGSGYFEGKSADTNERFLNLPDVALTAPVTGISSTPNGGGATLVAADGGVFCLAEQGQARPGFFGSLPGDHIVAAAPVVGIATTLGGLSGYWLVGADGGVFAFGNAKFYGSAESMHLPWADGT
jgi:hypothetical protein